MRSVLPRFVWIVAALVVLLLLAPSLALPLGPDAAMFFVSARKILHQGALHYRDIVDIKPPLIYHLYAGAMLLLGEQPIAIRIVDLMLQLATCASIVALIRRCGGGDAWAATSAVLYALLYGGLGYAYTMEVESYVGLLLTGSAWLALVRRTRAALVGAGALAGVALLLKFPLAVLLGVVVLGEWLVARTVPRTALRNTSLLVAGFAAVALLLPLYLVVGHAAGGFAEVSEYISGYARTKWHGLGGLAVETMRDLPVLLVRSLGLSVVVAAMASIVPALRTSSDDEGLRVGLLQTMLLALALFVVSLVVEGKFYPYQISRLYAPAAIAAGYSVVRLFAFVAARRGLRSRATAIAVVGAALLFSPIGSWVWFTATPVASLATGGDAAFDGYFDRMAVYYPRTELKRVAAAIDSSRGPADEVLTLSSIGALVHHFVGTVPSYRIYHSAFLLADFAPPAWRGEMRDFAVRERPRFIVVQRGDELSEFTGNDRSSDALVGLLGLEQLLAREYSVLLTTERFVVYRRR
jgi:4-amino-4-deoxy-L-arabinose transferase-like glycosyltransferase